MSNDIRSEGKDKTVYIGNKLAYKACTRPYPHGEHCTSVFKQPRKVTTNLILSFDVWTVL